MFNHRFRYLFILLLSLYTFLNTVLCNVYFYFRIEIEWYYALITIFLATLLTWEGNRIIEPAIRNRIPADKNKVRFLAIFFLAGNLVAVAAAFFPVYFVGNVIHDYSWQQNKNPLKLNIIYTGLVNLFFHLMNAIFFFFKEYERHWAEVEELRKVSSQAQIQLVRNQINPHFLFNNLNVLSAMVIKDNPDANQFIEEFSKVYRYVLNNQEKDLVKLGSELEFIEPYLFLLHKRFDEGLVVEIDIPVHHRAYYVIPIALQMLIENAIKHNVVSRAKPLRIYIHTNDNQNLIVRNNFQPRNSSDISTQMGLENIRKRYELISGRDLVILKTKEKFEVSLPLLNLN